MALRYTFQAILLLFAIGIDAPAHAGTQFVASYGTDSASCTRTAPCATIANALANASPNDTIVCLNTVSSIALFIGKSIDIECSGARAVLRDDSIGVAINIPGSPADPLRTVRLRGISIIGANSTYRYLYRGIDIVSAAVVSIEDVVISDVSQQGILDRRTGGQTKLFIKDSIIRNNGGTGIAIGSEGPATIVLDNVSSENNAYGIGAASGNQIMINRSVFSGNSAAGIEGDTGAQIAVNNSSISHNFIGVQGNLSVRLSNNDITFNNTALSGASGTFGNNRFSGNATMGTNPAPLGGASPDLGQQ